MFEFIRTHSRIFMGILVPLIVGSFVFLGNQGYEKMNEGGNQVVATVGRSDILQAEWDAAHRRSIDRIRQQAPNIDVKMFDTPEMRQRVLDDLVRERVLQAVARDAGFQTSDLRLLHSYQTDPQFASVRTPDGNIDKEQLKAALAAQGMSIGGLEQLMRGQLAMRQVFAGVTGTALVPAAAASSAFDAMFQQREAQIERFEAKAYAAKVTPSDAEIEAYYKDPKNAAQFKSPEQAEVEYLVLDLNAVKKGIVLSEDALRSYYKENEKRYAVREERRARHIQIKSPKDAPAAERAAAKAKAEALQAEVAKNPASFAEVARKNSQESASAARGGEVDAYFAKGDADPAYETALFALKPKEVSKVVEVDDGFYIIQLEAVRGGTVRSFDEVRAEIEEEAKAQEVQKRFAEAANEFSNLVYEQADSLQPAADKLKLEIQTAKGVTRTPDPNKPGPLSSPKFLEALFSADSLQSKRNTAAIEAGSNQLVSGRVKLHSPSTLLPLAEVSARVKEQLVATQSLALARKEGEARLAALRAAPATAMAVPPQAVSRAQTRELPADLISAVLKAPAAALPAVVGVDLGAEGYAVAKVTKVLGRDPNFSNAEQVQTQYGQSWAAAEAQALYAALKARVGVKMSNAGVADKKSVSSNEE